MQIKTRDTGRERRRDAAESASDSSLVDQVKLEKDALERRLLASSDPLPAQKNPPSRIFPVGVVVMLLLLMAQTLYLYRDQAVAIGFIASAFKSLGYTLPDKHRPEMIVLTNRVFTDVEREAGLYRLQLGLMNHASHPQPFPLIEVSLTDTKGVIQARNQFHARDYLPPSVVMSKMAPDEGHVVSFIMKSSVTDASGFILDFL